MGKMAKEAMEAKGNRDPLTPGTLLEVMDR